MGNVRSPNQQMSEIRCYYAAPLHSDMPRQGLTDFDYAARGYRTPESVTIQL
jgi:hypothetical protein